MNWNIGDAKQADATIKKYNDDLFNLLNPISPSPSVKEDRPAKTSYLILFPSLRIKLFYPIAISLIREVQAKRKINSTDFQFDFISDRVRSIIPIKNDNHLVVILETYESPLKLDKRNFEFKKIMRRLILSKNNNKKIQIKINLSTNVIEDVDE